MQLAERAKNRRTIVKNLKRVMALSLAVMMAVPLTSCGSSKSDTDDGQVPEITNYTDIKLGEDFTDLKAEISMINNRTDMQQEDYDGKTWDVYVKEFNEMYPNIKVNVETITDYDSTALLRLQSGDWGDIMLIPAVDRSELGTYYMSYGDYDTISKEVRFANDRMYDGEVYGIASSGTAQGVVYNKAVFAAAGITELPKTPDEFMTDLQLIKDNTDAIPLYTNYAAGWTMGAWDAYINGTATGDAKYMNQKLLHTKNPFSDPGDGTHAYNVYKVLYDAVANGLTEDDYSTTDWESSKSRLNNGEIGCMVLGSWAFKQIQAAGDHAEDVGYMPFPITVDGKQYATAGPNYSWGINADASNTNKQASLIFVKWMTEKSGYACNEGNMPVGIDDENWPEVYDAFDGIEYVSDEAPVEGEEDLLNALNADSELSINASGDSKFQELIEHAASKDKTFDEIMDDWNQAWSDAQETEGVEVTE